ncbi:MAG: hypothetical protein LBU32_14680 [Clostridiales bacterium]|jgi:hypothetical protein|nr:hypothetical protein [Clostridiales bacterium]
MMRIHASAKHSIIQEMMQGDDNLLNAAWLNGAAKASRSGCRHCLEAEDLRIGREEQDKRDFPAILEACRLRGCGKGARGIHMRLLNMKPPVHANIEKNR